MVDMMKIRGETPLLSWAVFIGWNKVRKAFSAVTTSSFPGCGAAESIFAMNRLVPHLSFSNSSYFTLLRIRLPIATFFRIQCPAGDNYLARRVIADCNTGN